MVKKLLLSLALGSTLLAFAQPAMADYNWHGHHYHHRVWRTYWYWDHGHHHRYRAGYWHYY